MSKPFANQTVIISGGLGDIGSATAFAFARSGASIALGDIKSHQVADETVASIEELGVTCHYQQVDVADDAAVQDWVDAVEGVLGVPTMVIANAAIVTRADIHTLTPAQWSRELRVNLDGAFFLSQVTTKKLCELNLPGSVVFVGSWAAYTAHTHIPAYSVSKAGLRMLCKCLALELASKHIRVNEVAPGYVNAGLSGQLWEEHPELMEKAKAKVPVKKLITPEEVADQILYLCHPKNRHMTGSTLLMDGGLSLP